VFLMCCVVLCRQRPCVGPITRPRSPTNCLIDSQVKTPRHRKVKRGRLRKKEKSMSLERVTSETRVSGSRNEYKILMGDILESDHFGDRNGDGKITINGDLNELAQCSL
jgi:hypothetical protein